MTFGFKSPAPVEGQSAVRVLRLRRTTHWQKYASFDSLLSRAGLERILEKNGLFEAPPLENCLTELTALLPELEQVVPIHSLDRWQTAKH